MRALRAERALHVEDVLLGATGVQWELAAVQQLQTDETLDREEDPTGGQHQEMSISSDGAAQGVDGTTQALAHSDAADASEDAKVAEQVVKRWQHAKAQALGVAHNLKPLEQVLEGPMLQQWLTRAEDVKSHGWAWEYQLNSLSIDKVESLSESRAMVEATLTEVAILKDRARTEEDDRYESTYRARYELRRGEGRGGYRAWKIIGGSVVY